jgi:hypothetical protein
MRSTNRSDNIKTNVKVTMLSGCRLDKTGSEYSPVADLFGTPQ